MDIYISNLIYSYDLGVSFPLQDFWFVSRDIPSFFGSGAQFRNVSTCVHPIITSLRRHKSYPCNGFVKQLASIADVLQYLILNSSIFTQSLTKKYLMDTCLNLPVHEFLPLFSIFIVLSLPWHNTFFYRSYQDPWY